MMVAKGLLRPQFEPAKRTSTPDLSYRPEIDGLRAVAVVVVMLFHAKLRFFGGYVGVDVFFVISGYLITSLIWKDIQNDHFSLARFWERRARRILPVLVIVVLTTLVAGWFLLLPRDYLDLGGSIVAQSLMVSNVYFWRESGYFAAPAEVKPLLHFWSLAVEEQFYVLLPLLAIVLRHWKMSSRLFLFSILGLVSFALSIYAVKYDRDSAFYLLPSRGWELLLGCGLASLPAMQGVPKTTCELLSAAGLCAILAAVSLYNRDTHFPGAAALLPCGGTALFIWSNGQTSTLAGRLLSWRPVVFIGVISYSLYLWHWPVLVFTQYWAMKTWHWEYRCALLAACLPLAVMSWWLIETPIRKRRLLTRPRSVFASSALALTSLLIVGTVIDRTAGANTRFTRQILDYADGSLDIGYRRDSPVDRDGNCRFDAIGNPDAAVKCLIWGDSHAKATVAAIENLSEKCGGRCIVAAHDATYPLLNCISTNYVSLKDRSVAFNRSVVDFVRERRVKNVLLVAAWEEFPRNVLADDGTDGVALQAQFRRQLSETVVALQQAGAKVWIMQQVPDQVVDVPKALARAMIFGYDPKSVGVPLLEHWKRGIPERAVIEEMADHGAVVLEPCKFLADKAGLCRAELNGRALYSDHYHLSTYGARRLMPLFRPIFCN
ncbi:MAG TPA: acyltransferase family protein [Planctomycetaceae bacterium]|nr:acyltransferase family protein [Planctomycetaceae bacterium]